MGALDGADRDRAASDCADGGCAARMAVAWDVPVEAVRTGALGIEAVLWRNRLPGARHLGNDLAPERLVFSYHPSGIARGEVHLDGRRAFAGRIPPGSWMVVPGDAAPEAEVTGPWGLLHVYVPRAALEGVLDAHGVRPDLGGLSRCLFGTAPDLARIGRSLLQEVRDTASGADPIGGLMFDGLAQGLMAGIVRTAADVRPRRAGLSPAQRRRLDALIDAQVEVGLAGRLTLSMLAAEVSLSPAHLCRAFAASYGRPPMREVEARRVARGTALLTTSRCSVADAAAAVGYDDPSHFARAVRRVTGLTPTAWRRSGGQ